MPASAEQQLNSLPSLSKSELTKLWLQLFNSAPNPKIRRPLMIRFLAYRIQEQSFGSLAATAARRLRQLSGTVAVNPNSKISAKLQIRPGTRLVREWQDQAHLVNVETDGYEYRGHRYRSLSEIARLITGTRWSGPLFFGVRSKSSYTTSQGVQ